MTLPNQSKLKSLLQNLPDTTVATANWLQDIGISKQLRLHYQKSGWLELISRGVFKKFGDKISWEGGILAIQKQLKLGIYPAALTAIALQGSSHYIRMGKEKVYIFALPHTTLPKWFKTYQWGADISYHRTAFLPDSLGLEDYEIKNFSIKISSLERAILECLYLAPNEIDLVECYQILEGLTMLRPKLLQQLLEKCTSIKVVRLFLYLAERCNHSWLKHLDKTKFDIGKGDRSVVKNGVYVASHKITISKELADL